MATRREFLTQAAVVGIAAMAVRTAHAGNATAPTSNAGHDGFVQTVLGPIAASKLGFTLTHEHVVPADHAASGSRRTFSSRAISVADAVDRLKAARDAGVDTVVDLSPSEAGRQANLRA
jgi:hypothetical protein